MKKKIQIYQLLQMTVICSFIGFLVEDCYKLFTAGYIDNRFMFLPFLLGYGFFITVVYLLVGTPKRYFPLMDKDITFKTPFNYFAYFLMMVVLVSLGEIALGTIVEKIGGFYYWDYSNLPLNITRYTSLPTSLGFGFIITVFMGWCFGPIMKFTTKHMQSHGWKIVTCVFVGMLLLDFVISFGIMISTGERNLLWRLKIF